MANGAFSLLHSSKVVTHRGLGLLEKPVPDACIYAFEASGIKAQNATVIEDNVDGVAAAKTAGAHMDGVPVVFSQRTDLRAADAPFGYWSDINSVSLLPDSMG